MSKAIAIATLLSHSLPENIIMVLVFFFFFKENLSGFLLLLSGCEFFGHQRLKHGIRSDLPVVTELETCLWSI